MRVLLVLLLALSTVPVFAQQDLEFKSISASNGEFSVNIQFGELKFQHKPKQMLESVSIGLGQTELELLNAQLRVYPKSFSIVSLDEGVYIMARHADDQVYNMDVFIYTTGGALKQKLTGTINEPVTDSVLVPDAKPVKKEQLDLRITTKQDSHSYWRESYDIYIKTFDGKQNSRPQFDQFDGVLKDVNVNVTLTNERDGIQLGAMSGKTDKNGFWHGSLIITENLVKGGKYLVDVAGTHSGVEVKQELEMFVVPVVRPTTTNSTES